MKEQYGNSTGEPGGEPESTVRTGNTRGSDHIPDAGKMVRNGAASPCETVQQEPVAWAVMKASRRYDTYDFKQEADAISRMMRDEGDFGWEVVPLYAAPQDRVVRLPREPDNMDAGFASGWFFHSSQVKAALRDAGVKWEAERE